MRLIAKLQKVRKAKIDRATKKEIDNSIIIIDDFRLLSQ